MSLDQISLDLTHWAHTLGTPVEMFLRLLLAAACGGLVGLEREMRGRQAGFRTNVLVCVGSALVMIVSTSMASVDWRGSSHAGVQISVDPGRIAYGVMAGIGFLGAGTIIHHRGSIHGLTTAAALWCVAAIGLSAGLGLYVVTVLASLVVLGTLWLLDYFEMLLPRRQVRIITLRTPWRAGCVKETIERIRAHGFDVVGAGFDRRDETSHVLIDVQIAFLSTSRVRHVETVIGDDPELELVALRDVQN